MFSYLVETAFPFVGDFLGILTSIANSTPMFWLDSIELVIDGLEDNVLLLYNNYFTGVGFDGLASNGIEIPMGIFTVPILKNIIYNLIVLLFSTFLFFDIQAPLWIALPIAIAIWGFLFGAIKFFYNIIKFLLLD